MSKTATWNACRCSRPVTVPHQGGGGHWSRGGRGEFLTVPQCWCWVPLHSLSRAVALAGCSVAGCSVGGHSECTSCPPWALLPVPASTGMHCSGLFSGLLALTMHTVLSDEGGAQPCAALLNAEELQREKKEREIKTKNRETEFVPILCNPGPSPCDKCAGVRGCDVILGPWVRRSLWLQSSESKRKKKRAKKQQHTHR